jgi:hemoglobin
LACAVGAGLGAPLRAQQDAAETKALDRKVYDLLREVINTGADLYNRQGDRAGCYRLYQGSLMTLRPLLAHRPELQQAIDRGLAGAEQEPNVGRRAFALRAVIDEIRAASRPAAPAEPKKAEAPKKPPAPATLWDRLGGEEGVRKVVDDFVDLAAKDPKVNFSRGGRFKPDAAQMAALKQKLVELVSSVSGGPLKYTSKSMKEVHKGMGITEAEFDAAVADLREALRVNNVDPADIAAMLKAVEATRKDIVEPKKPEDKKPEKK